MPRQYTTRRERKRLWCAFFLLLALAAFLLWQELSPWDILVLISFWHIFYFNVQDMILQSV